MTGKTKKIIGVDIFIPMDLKKRIFSKSKSSKIKLLNGDSTSAKVFNKIKKLIGNYKNILIHLDSNHTKEHVLKFLSTVTFKKLRKFKNWLFKISNFFSDE